MPPDDAAATSAKVYSLLKDDDDARKATAEIERAAQDMRLHDFYAYMPTHHYLHVPTRELWPAESVNGRITWPMGGEGKPIKPSAFLDRNRAIEQLIWAPGQPEVIEGKVLDQGGWIASPDIRVFNLYRAPSIIKGNGRAARRWRDHLVCLWGADAATHIERWCAAKIQHPEIKVNHALVLCSEQGTGKDTILEPVKHAVGHWNFGEISPVQMLGRFNGWAKSVITRVSEARDLGDVDRFAFYDHSKVYIAAPPDVLRVDEKNIREHSVANILGLIITTNHRTDGIYLPPDDRRHFVASSEITKEEFAADYWTRFWSWYANGGLADVATYLRELDLSGFDPKAPPPKTAAWQAIVHANQSQDDSEIADLIETIGRPDVVTLNGLRSAASARNLTEVVNFLTWRQFRRQVPHVLERAGYVLVANPNAKDGRWVVGKNAVVVYGRRDLNYQQQCRAVQKLQAAP
jgi:hypothetical protein